MRCVWPKERRGRDFKSIRSAFAPRAGNIWLLNTMMSVFVGAGLLAGVSGDLSVAAAADLPLKPASIWKVPDDLEGESGDAADDVSGIACLPAADGERACLIVNDQNRFAQRVVLADEQIRARKKVKLIGKKPDPATFGKAPEAGCKKEDDFKDLDGEGVAYADTYFYVVGSHGCSRGGAKFRLSSYILARIRVDGAGKPQDDPQTTYRLSDALSHDARLKPHVSKTLEPDGLNVECIAVVGDTVFAGLRAPSIDESAFLVGAKISDLFAPGHAPLLATPTVIPISIGNGVGIRDLAALEDGRLLVLTGPARDIDGRHDLYVVEPTSGAKVHHLATLAKVEGENADGERKTGKAEALLVLRESPLRVLVLFDGLKNGGPREYHLDR